MYNFY